MLTIASVIDFLESFAPKRLAAAWDNVGLLLGDRAASVERIMTCLTMTPESAAEAIAEKANLIVTHHPVLFHPVQRLTTDTSEGRMLLALIQAGVAVYSPHTAFDNTQDGINELLGSKLGLQGMVPLRRLPALPEYKLVVFVPDADLAKVSDALFSAGAGLIGQYRECSFRLAGTGTFFGTDATNPTVGEKGRREEVGEWRLEVICPEAKLEQAIAALRKAHSYEEPAFDVYPLRAGLSNLGDGRIGRLAHSTSLGGFAKRVKQSLNCSAIQLVGDAGRAVETVAIVCGAGGELLRDAIRARVDVFLTGELRFHDYLLAQAEELALVLPGHYATERVGVEDLAGRLQRQWTDVRVWASKRETDPVQWIG
jgi:dinuclear metal center YbgI/SA1388 family protein